MNPLVSVIIPAYNMAHYLGEAIDSALRQSYQPVEIIVIDDGSTDDTAAVAAAYADRVVYRYQEHAGAGAARNRGLALAQGAFIAFLDADDWWEAEKTAWQMAALSEDPILDIVGGRVQQFHSPDLSPELRATIHCPAEPAAGYLPGTVLCRRAAVDEIGAFATDLHVGEFIDWMARARELGLAMNLLPQIVLHRRLHATNTGRTMKHERGDYARLVRAALQRRRA